MAKEHVDLRRNWATGFSILEISKYIMFSLYYKAIRPAFEDRVTMCFSDTGDNESRLRFECIAILIV